MTVPPVRLGMTLLDVEETLERCRLVGTALDDAIPVPGTDRRIGLDPILGVLPVAGDAVAAVASSYIVLEAARLGVPSSTLARMGANVALDFGIGSIPVVGDLFDAGFKANKRNVELLEEHVDVGDDETVTDDGDDGTTTSDGDDETATGDEAAN